MAVPDLCIRRIDYSGMDRNNYGFPDDREVVIDPFPGYSPPIELSRERERELRDIFCKDHAMLNPLLETVGRIVNGSIRFGGESPQVRYLLKRFPDYTPDGSETAVGTCIEAGRTIRHILYALRLEGMAFREERCRHVRVPPGFPPDSFFHDCTVVYDEHCWALVNSKSPNPDRQFNLVPRDRLVFMGPPFVDQREYDLVLGTDRKSGLRPQVSLPSGSASCPSQRR